MTTVRELQNQIATMKARHAQALASDLTKLRVRFGNVAVAEAQRALEQHELRNALSASADRHRRHAARQADLEAQALFARKARVE
jgi:hypothetical protein